MLLRSAAIGVRSSCEASAMSWRWDWIERSSASRVWLKLAASRRSSSAPVSSRRRGRSSALVTCSVWAEKRSIGASAARAMTVPKMIGEQDPGADQQAVGEQQPVQDRVHRGERQCDLDRVSLGVVAIADGEDLDVRALDGGAEVVAAARRCGRS